MNILPCNKYFCKCIEYLNFGNKKHLNLYKHCFITSNNNLKYKLTYDTNINNGFHGSIFHYTYILSHKKTEANNKNY